MEADITKRSRQREGYGVSAQHRGPADQRTEKGKRKKKMQCVCDIVQYVSVFAERYLTCHLLCVCFYFYFFPGVPSSAG